MDPRKKPLKEKKESSSFPAEPAEIEKDSLKELELSAISPKQELSFSPAVKDRKSYLDPTDKTEIIILEDIIKGAEHSQETKQILTEILEKLNNQSNKDQIASLYFSSPQAYQKQNGVNNIINCFRKQDRMCYSESAFHTALDLYDFILLNKKHSWFSHFKTCPLARTQYQDSKSISMAQSIFNFFPGKKLTSAIEEEKLYRLLAKIEETELEKKTEIINAIIAVARKKIATGSFLGGFRIPDSDSSYMLVQTFMSYHSKKNNQFVFSNEKIWNELMYYMGRGDREGYPYNRGKHMFNMLLEIITSECSKHDIQPLYGNTKKYFLSL